MYQTGEYMMEVVSLGEWYHCGVLVVSRKGAEDLYLPLQRDCEESFSLPLAMVSLQRTLRWILRLVLLFSFKELHCL